MHWQVESKGCLPEGDARLATLAVLRALGPLHAASLVHGYVEQRRPVGRYTRRSVHRNRTVFPYPLFPLTTLSVRNATLKQAASPDRDVKLENMLMKIGEGVGSVKLCDFGAAILLEDGEAAQPITGFTPNYVGMVAGAYTQAAVRLPWSYAMY